MKNHNFLIVILAAFFFSACNKDGVESPPPDDTITFNPTPAFLNIPSFFPVPHIPEANPLTEEGIALGRRLYYDSILDANSARACAGCHQQANAFSSPDFVIQHQNLAWSKYFLWNGRIEGSLEDAMLFEVEEFFNTNMNTLNDNADYKYLFRTAFGVKTISSKEVSYALAQFLRTLITGNSRYDKAMRHEIFLSDEETMGYTIFFTEKGDCFHCHSDILFTDQQFHNIGLDSVFDATNSGRYTFTANASDIGKFKSPSLRNAELTAPYMHDGRFQTLDEVIEHYNSGVKKSATLDPIMTKPGKENGLKLTDEEKQALVAFLKALTDTSFVNNPGFSNPF